MSTLYVNNNDYSNGRAVNTSNGYVSKTSFRNISNAGNALLGVNFVDSDNFLWGLDPYSSTAVILKFDTSANIVFSKTLTGVNINNITVMCQFSSGTILFAVKTGTNSKEIRKLDSSGNVTVYTPASALSSISGYCVGLTVASNGKVFAAFNTSIIYEITNSGAAVSVWKNTADVAFTKLATNNGDLFALARTGLYGYAGIHRYLSNKNLRGVVALSDSVGSSIVDFVLDQSSNIYAATVAVDGSGNQIYCYVYKFTGAQGISTFNSLPGEPAAFSLTPALITDGYYSFGYYISGDKTSTSVVERAVDTDLYYVYSGTTTTVANGLHTIGSDTTIYHTFSNGTDNGVKQGYAQLGTVWHHFTDGADDGLVQGYQYNVTGDGLMHHFTDGTDGGLVQGYHDNVTGDGLMHHFTDGTDNGLVQGLHNDVFPPNWFSFTDGVGTQLEDGYHKIGGVWYSISSGVGSLVTGYHNDVTGDNLWYLFTAGSEAILAGCYNSVTDSYWHRFSGGNDSGYADGYGFDVVGGVWHSFSNGFDDGLVQGNHNDVIPGGEWYSFTDGVPAGPIEDPDPPGGEGITSYGQVGTVWHGSFSNGTDTGPLTGYYNNVTGDELWHQFIGGTDNGVFDGFAQVPVVWHQFTDGVDGGPVSGNRNDVYGNNIYYHWVSGVNDGLIIGDRNDVIPGGLWYRFTAGQPAILDGLVNVNFGLFWHIFDNGTDLGVADGWNCTGGEGCTRTYHIFDMGRDMGTPAGYLQYMGPELGGCPCMFGWQLYVGGRSIGALEGWYNSINGSGKWEFYECGGYTGVAGGIRDDVMGDGLWHNFGEGLNQGVNLGTANGEYYNLSGDGKTHLYTDGQDNGPVE